MQARRVDRTVARNMVLRARWLFLDAVVQIKRDDERRPLAFPRAFRANRTSVEIHQMPRDRQAEPQTAVCSGAGAVPLTKAFEDLRQQVLGDARTGVGDP